MTKLFLEILDDARQSVLEKLSVYAEKRFGNEFSKKLFLEQQVKNYAKTALPL